MQRRDVKVDRELYKGVFHYDYDPPTSHIEVEVYVVRTIQCAPRPPYSRKVGGYSKRDLTAYLVRRVDDVTWVRRKGKHGREWAKSFPRYFRDSFSLEQPLPDCYSTTREQALRKLLRELRREIRAGVPDWATEDDVARNEWEQYVPMRDQALRTIARMLSKKGQPKQDKPQVPESEPEPEQDE